MLIANKLTLFELNQRIKLILSENFSSNYWVIAEISEIKEANNGHCYLELVQKDEQSDNPNAKARATIWAYTYRMLKPYFETSTGRSLSPGIKVLLLVEVVFHELYGYSLNVVDIEPAFTIGDIEQKRRETIEKLVSEGIFDMNKGLEIPLTPKRVAVISSALAAGYQDFVNQLVANPYGYKFEHKLFQATMQGGEAEMSIINALEQIFEQHTNFDLVTIIRGGGSQTDLSCFDSYLLSAHVAQFPLPILTGIGHEKDISVVDLVANTKLKTPTAVAEFLIDQFIYAETEVNNLSKTFTDIVERNIMENWFRLQKITSIIPQFTYEISTQQKIIINKRLMEVKSLLHNYLKRQADSHVNFIKSTKDLSKIILYSLDKDLKMSESSIYHLDPNYILSRGYSITQLNGKVLTNKKEVKKGEVITTILKKGTISSRVS